VTALDWVFFLLLIVAVGVTVPFLGRYMAKVFAPETCGAPVGDRFFSRIDNGVYRLCGIDSKREQRWNVYAMALIAFSAGSMVVVYLIQRVQEWLPFNPTGVHNVPGPLSFNTAASFITNTNWQNYSGETTMSHLTQMVGLSVQNFVSAAVGLAVAIALVRGLARKRQSTIGNFWVDLTRGITRVLLPFAFVFAIVFMSQGVIQNLHGATKATTVQGTTQQIPGGPVASQESIKEVGTNGGGFFNANSAHPFENPNGLTNFFQLYLMLVIAFSLAWTFGCMVGDKKQGMALLAAMFILWIASAGFAMAFEGAGNSSLNSAGVNQSVTSTNVGGNMEGKEARFGAPISGLYGSSATGTSTGSVIAAHDSFTPLGGMVPMVNMMLGEVSPGGVGAGLFGMLHFAILAVFIAGLMVGRTPEYLGKKIQAAEMKLIMVYILAAPIVILAFAGASVVIVSARSSILNTGPHGLSEVVYAFTSAGNNNGSAFGGLTGNTDWYNVTLGITMLVGRYILMIAALGVAGSLVRKQPVPPSAGTFPTKNALFVALLVGVIVIVVGLTYLPVLSLGPIVERLAH
jgi:K+-transporting ATPase ATPase A chain